MARIQPRSMARSRRRNLDNLAIILGGLFVVVAIVTAIVAFNLVKKMVLSWTMTSLEGVPVTDTTPVPIVNAEGTPVPLDVPLDSTTNQAAAAIPWDGNSRVTLLVMGLDYRDWEAGGPPRTDTMMLLTLDPISKTAGMLSVPRDTWVNIPKVNTYGKINEAYRYGELYKLPGGGPALAAETVHSLIGVPINYYAQVDFYAFEKFIDEIGGIDVTVDSELKIDPLGKGNTIYLKPGTTHINGAAALGFARMRYTNGGDFDRADRQQQVILAIRDQILKLDQMPNLIKNAGNIYKDLSGGIRTNLSIDQALKLALFAQQIDKTKIKKGVLGPNEVTFAKSPDGLDILIPVPDKIRIVRDEIFTTGGPAGPAAGTTDTVALMKTESAKVTFNNGSSTAGMATQTTDYFKKIGVNVVATGNADKVYTDTWIYIYGSTPYTAAYLASVMNVPTSRIVSQYQQGAKSDIVVIVGQDWARKNPMSK